MSKNIVIIDLDGTLSKPGERLKFLQQEPKDWNSFYQDYFNDEPIPEMVDLVYNLYDCGEYDIVFCTGRRECIRDKTRLWLQSHIPPSQFWQLLMRKNDDLRSDVIVKPELIRDAGIDFNDIAFVIEDRSKMVKRWRELGVIALQCAEGDF